MAKSSADDEELRRACEAAIEGTKQKVVMSIRVAKSRGIWGKSGKLGRNMAKPRVLALSTKAKAQRSKAFLRVLKYSTGGVLEPAKLYKLKHLSKVEVITNDPSGCTFMLGFDNLRSQSVAPPQWTMRNIDDRNRLLLCILNICKDVLGRLPKVVGIDVVEMALWAKDNKPTVTVQGNLYDGPIPSMVTETDLKVSVERELVTQAEEEDMDALLGNYVMGIGEAEAFSERLKRELLALEAANVHAILESEPLVDEVLQGLETAMNCVDDMDEWLSMFNVKLRHMREDIESIETRNNKLEMQSVNNKALIEELDKLLERLRVPSEYAACLTGGSFDEARMLQNIEACEWLTGALRGLEVPNLDPSYANIRAVKEKRAELEKLKATFVRRASEFLRNYFASLVDFMISDKSYFSQRGQLKRPDHADLRYKCRTYARLLQHLKSLDKNCLGPLRKAYCSSLNLLLRREAREFANELRASTKASRNPTVWLEASTGSGQNMNNTDTSTVSDAYAKMLTIFIPLLVDESSFFAHFMCFEVPALVPPGGHANGNKTGSNDDDTNDDDLGIMDIDENDNKTGKSSAELGALNESLQDLLDGIQNGIFLVRKLMQQDLYASCLMIWSQEFLCSLAVLLMKLVTRLKETSVMFGRWAYYHIFPDLQLLQPVWSSTSRDNLEIWLIRHTQNLMASGSGGRDPAWKYCAPLEGHKNGTICNYCGLNIKSGGITRLKFHLSHTDPNSNIKKCPNVPSEVKQEMKQLLERKGKAKAKKAADMEEIRAELRGTMGGKHYSLIDDDEEEEGDEDVHMYPADMHPDERDEYREVVRASKASEWNRDQVAGFMRGKRKIGESSQPGDPSRRIQRSQSVRHTDPSPPIAPSLYKSSAAKQKSLKNMFKGGSIKETMGRLISKFFIYESVPPQKADSHHFKNMIFAAQQAGMGIEPPSPYEIKSKYLEMEHKDMEDYVNLQREKWETYGCTIMCDGWTGPTKLSIINFMVYSKGSTIFLKSVDASDKIKDNKYIYGLLKDVIKEVGEANVVQIVTDNGSAFVKAGKLLMKKYNLYWTPCAAHCIDLMFEDIGKRDSVAQLIGNGRKITNFIYNHGWLLAKMRQVCGGDIVRPGATRFATNYIALDSLLKKRADLKKVFISNDWSSHKLSRTVVGHEVERLMFDHQYWEKVEKLVSIYEALYTVLRIVDSEIVPTMPFVYELIRLMKANLERLKAKEWVRLIIADRWDRTLKHPLHATAYYLNPKFQYRPGVGSNPELLQAVHDVFSKLDPNAEGLSNFGNELILFRDARKGFGDRAAIASRSKMVPAEWWFLYGNHAPTLRSLALKVFSQTASSSACERNWSTFALIHTKQRNRLAYPRLQQLVFCYYNMKLKIRDMEAETDKVAENNFLDLLEISAEFGEEEENQLFQWVRPLHLDDEDGNPDPRIAAHVREAGVNVERVLSEEVHSESFSQDTRDSFQPAVTSRPSFDSSVEHSSRPSFAGTSTTGYDGSRGEGTNDGSDTGNDGGDIADPQQSQYPLSPFTGEDDFTHATQDEDHGSRRASPGVGAIGKPSRGRQRRMTPYNEDSLSASFESMSIGTQFSDSSNEANIFPPYTMSYGQPSSHPSGSIGEEYGMVNYPHDPQMSFQIPYQMQEGFQTSMWVNPEFPIHGEVVGRSQHIYAWHVRNYNQYYCNTMSWYEYCLHQDGIPSSNNVMEPHRSSFWF